MISDCVAHPLATRTVLSAMSTIDLPTEEIWLSTTVAHASTRLYVLLGFLASPPRASEHCTLLPRADTVADVI